MFKLNINDDLFPDSLRIIPNPPNELYCEGNLELFSNPSIAIVGSRNCTKNGEKITEKFAKELSMSGITIISGLAKGVDTTAHTFSYNNIGKTIAVLGSGLERIYPKENIDLYTKILDEGGLIISEYPPRKMYNSDYFVARNRIISGLSLGILVIEAAYRSGTSTTANHAIKQGKPIFSIPHEIWDSHGVGTNRLIKKGANLVTSSEDILNYLKLSKIKKKFLQLKSNGAFEKNISDSNLSDSNLSKDTKIKKFNNKKVQQVYDIIYTNKIISLNNIAKLTGFHINDVVSISFLLEVDGYIKKVEGGYICT